MGEGPSCYGDPTTLYMHCVAPNVCAVVCAQVTSLLRLVVGTCGVSCAFKDCPNETQH